MTTAYASGKFVAEHLTDRESGERPSDERIQPNGVDVTIGELYRASGTADLRDSEYHKPDRMEMSEWKLPGGNSYKLQPGPYTIVYGEKIEIPDGYVGRVYPRSRFMRCGLHLVSALWDQGYEGVGEGLLLVPRTLFRVCIEADMAIGQMTFIEAAQADSYDGAHQSERLERDEGGDQPDGGEYKLTD